VRLLRGACRNAQNRLISIVITVGPWLLYLPGVLLGQKEGIEHHLDRRRSRQVIEAGIKEGKYVFAIRHLKVYPAPAIFLQEQFAVFAANFIRWAALWLCEQCPQLPDNWLNSAHPGVKEQFLVAAHTSAWVIWQDQGCLLRFTDQSLFSGRSLSILNPLAIQLPLPFAQNAVF
jgi:hypothetical protein